MKNNKGFSFVEMIIVVAIISILVVGAAFGFTYAQGREAEKAAREIASVFEEAKAVAMSKYETSVTITKDLDGNIVAITATKDKKDSEAVESVSKICSDSVSIICAAMEPCDSMTFTLDRTTGGFDSIPEQEIYIEKANTKKVITITKGTGKITIE